MTNILNDANLVEHWNLNEASGNRPGVLNAYTFTNSNSVGQDSSGKVDQAAAFVASSSQSLYVDDADLANFDIRFSSGNAFSLSLWVKYSGSGGYYVFFSGAPSTSISIVSGNLNVFGYTFAAVLGLPISAGDWHHIAYSVSPTSSDSAYIIATVDGSTEYNGSTGPDAAGTVFSEFRIGGTAGAYLDGSIDHVSFFDRALSLSELGELYSGGSPPEYVAPASGVPGGMTRTMHTTMSRSMVVNMGNSGD